MSGKYDDILQLPHHVSPSRKRMTMAERAAQFSPFAALTGYEDAVLETGRITERQIDLNEDAKAALDRKQQMILATLAHGERPRVTVTYFRPDAKKDGGVYLDFTGAIKKIEETGNALVFMDGTRIPFEFIFDFIRN